MSDEKDPPIASHPLPDAPPSPERREGGDRREMVNHPGHYNQSKIEVIDALEAWKLSPNLWQTVKYIARAGHKGLRLEDLRKAEWYLHREIQMEIWPELTSQEAQVREINEVNILLDPASEALALTYEEVAKVQHYLPMYCKPLMQVPFPLRGPLLIEALKAYYEERNAK